MKKFLLKVLIRTAYNVGRTQGRIEKKTKKGKRK